MLRFDAPLHTSEGPAPASLSTRTIALSTAHDDSSTGLPNITQEILDVVRSGAKTLAGNEVSSTEESLDQGFQIDSHAANWYVHHSIFKVELRRGMRRWHWESISCTAASRRRSTEKRSRHLRRPVRDHPRDARIILRSSRTARSRSLTSGSLTRSSRPSARR